MAGVDGSTPGPATVSILCNLPDALRVLSSVFRVLTSVINIQFHVDAQRPDLLEQYVE